MKFNINNDNIEFFKITIWLNLLIGFYNIYLYSQSDWWFNFIIGSLNIGAWVFLRKVKV